MITLDRTWKIEEIIDTRCRDFETKQIIPGTGEQVPCECCGRLIEVHAIVSNGTQRAMVGTQCCKKAGKKFGPEFTSPTCQTWWKVTYLLKSQQEKLRVKQVA